MQKPHFHVIGIYVRTTNENGQAKKDIEALWHRYIEENISNLIPQKIDNAVYAIYTNYDSDYTKPYDTILGCMVKDLDIVPEGMVGITVPSSSYREFKVVGDLRKDIVIKKWNEIWQMDLDRLYTADYEVYSERNKDPESAEVSIYIAVQ